MTTTIDSGNTAWMLTSTGLVLFMTIPGLALFYGGLVRTKNVLSVLMQCFSITALVTVIWVAVGYSLAFTGAATPGLNAVLGGFSKAFFANVPREALSGSIPESVFAMFQLTFAIITPALIIGAFAERMSFAAMLALTALWSLVVVHSRRGWGSRRRRGAVAGADRRSPPRHSNVRNERSRLHQALISGQACTSRQSVGPDPEPLVSPSRIVVGPTRFARVSTKSRAAPSSRTA